MKADDRLSMYRLVERPGKACQALAGDPIAGRATSRRGQLTLEPAIARFERARAARGAAQDERAALDLENASWALREAVDAPGANGGPP